MLNNLREATRELHEQIEGENTAGLIMDHSISLEQYKLLLLQNYIAYYVTENCIAGSLPDYTPTKHQRLKKDLEALQVDLSPVETYAGTFECADRAEALGAAYVVEGSSMGGMMIARELANCPKLASIEKHHFFNGDRSNVKSWNSFTKQLNSTEFSEEEKERAAAKARETFEFFGRVFRHTL